MKVRKELTVVEQLLVSFQFPAIGKQREILHHDLLDDFRIRNGECWLKSSIGAIHLAMSPDHLHFILGWVVVASYLANIAKIEQAWFWSAQAQF